MPPPTDACNTGKLAGACAAPYPLLKGRAAPAGARSICGAGLGGRGRALSSAMLFAARHLRCGPAGTSGRTGRGREIGRPGGVRDLACWAGGWRSGVQAGRQAPARVSRRKWLGGWDAENSRMSDSPQPQVHHRAAYECAAELRAQKNVPARGFGGDGRGRRHGLLDPPPPPPPQAGRARVGRGHRARRRVVNGHG